MDIRSFGKSENFVRFLSFEYKNSLSYESEKHLALKGALYCVLFETLPR